MADDNPTTQNTAIQSEQSFPLIAIMQMITFCVAFVSCIDFNAFADKLKPSLFSSPEDVLIPFVAISFLGFLLGAFLGLGQIRKWRSMLLCGTTGAVVLLLLAVACAAPARPAQAIFACLLPLVTTLILRSRTP